MEIVVKFLQDNKIFYLATVDEDKPKVRPFGVALDIDGKINICTGNWKDVFKQIQKNPNVEISATREDGTFLRLSGKVSLNTSDSTRKRFFDALPSLRELYGKKEDSFEVLKFDDGATAIFQNMKGEKEVIRL
jgi:uncharacterized pyridoxamine 5'-phosphate oxidase family protein